MSTCILVLGMHRSGTSLLAAILHTLGVHMGDRFRAPDEHNTTGYYEDLDWRDLNQSILRASGGTWYTPPKAWQLAYAAQEVNPDIAALVEAKSQHDLWGFKDPRTCLTIPLIFPFLPDDTRIIFIRREEDAVVASLTKRADLRGYYEPPEHWHNLYQEYDDRIKRFVLKARRRLFIIPYEHLIGQDRHLNVAAIARFCGLGLSSDFKDKVAIACQLIRPR